MFQRQNMQGYNEWICFRDRMTGRKKKNHEREEREREKTKERESAASSGKSNSWEKRKEKVVSHERQQDLVILTLEQKRQNWHTTQNKIIHDWHMPLYYILWSLFQEGSIALKTTKKVRRGNWHENVTQQPPLFLCFLRRKKDNFLHNPLVDEKKKYIHISTSKYHWKHRLTLFLEFWQETKHWLLIIDAKKKTPSHSLDCFVDKDTQNLCVSKAKT